MTSSTCYSLFIFSIMYARLYVPAVALWLITYGGAYCITCGAHVHTVNLHVGVLYVRRCVPDDLMQTKYILSINLDIIVHTIVELKFELLVGSTFCVKVDTPAGRGLGRLVLLFC